MIKVYTAGKMGTGWRSTLPAIAGVEWLHPLKPDGATKENHYLPKMFIARDLSLIQRCDVLLMVFEPTSVSAQSGGCTEVGLAYAWGKIIIGVIPNKRDVRFQRRFPLGLCTSEFTNLDKAVECIRFMADSTQDPRRVR